MLDPQELKDEFLRRTDVTYLALRDIPPEPNPVSGTKRITAESVASAALNKGFKHFCTWPHHLSSIKTRLPGMAVVIAFPVGIASVDEKLNDIARIAQVAPYVNEFDIVLNVATGPETVLVELGQLMYELHSCYDADRYIFKFIIETPVWSTKELNDLSRAIQLTPIRDYPNMMIKTCTGTRGGVEESHIKSLSTQLMTSKLKLKVSGGIRTLDQVRLLIEKYDVERLGIGHEAAFQILKEISALNKK